MSDKNQYPTVISLKHCECAFIFKYLIYSDYREQLP